MVERYRAWFKLFRFRGDAAFAKPEIYEFCEEQRLTYFIRLPHVIGLPISRPYLNLSLFHR